MRLQRDGEGLKLAMPSRILRAHGRHTSVACSGQPIICVAHGFDTLQYCAHCEKSRNHRNLNGSQLVRWSAGRPHSVYCMRVHFNSQLQFTVTIVTARGAKVWIDCVAVSVNRWIRSTGRPLFFYTMFKPICTTIP